MFFKLEKVKHAELRQLPALLGWKHELSQGAKLLSDGVEGTLALYFLWTVTSSHTGVGTSLLLKAVLRGAFSLADGLASDLQLSLWKVQVTNSMNLQCLRGGEGGSYSPV